jgi:uncharacterized protein with PQ loop repeat
MKGLYHLHLRARGARETEPYPARKVSLWVLDIIVLTAGVIGPLMTIPQILKIIVLHNAAGISTLTWGMYALLDIPWIVYGIAHASRPILLTYILWFLVNTFVAVEAILFGAGLF